MLVATRASHGAGRGNDRVRRTIETGGTMESCRMAFIGAGGMTREHVRAFRDVPGVELAGLYSRTRAKAEALAGEFGIGLVCDSTEELYDRTRADLVVMAVPELAARAIALSCFEFPWTLLAEKPLGYSLGEAQEIQAAAVAHGRKVLVGLNRRFLSSSRTVLADLAQQPGPRFIQVHDQQSLAAARAIGHPEPVVKHWMYANSIHLVDYLRLLGRGRITTVRPALPWNDGTAAAVVAVVEFESGDRGLYQGIWSGPGPWMASVTTAAKRWEMRPLEQAAFQLAGERQLNPVEAHAWDKDFKPGFRLQAEHAVAAALGRPSDAATLDQAMETMRLISAIFA